MAGPNYPIYPTHLFLYEECPKQFLWKCGWEGIDLGDGPGKRKPAPKDKDQHHALIGTVIQRAVEDFYNLQMWRNLETLEKDLRDKVKLYALDYKEKFFLGKFAPSMGEILQTCQSGVRNFLVTAKAHRLVSTKARSEEKIKVNYKGLYLGSKIDFILPKKEELLILDGKNTKHKMKYTKADQIRFYSLVYEAKYGKKPDKLGFLWYRFPYDESTGEQGIDWISCTDRDYRDLEDRIRVSRDNMLKENFQATPTPKVCRFCDYESVCPERQAQKKENADKRGAKKKSLPIIPSGIFTMNDLE